MPRQSSRLVALLIYGLALLLFALGSGERTRSAASAAARAAARPQTAPAATVGAALAQTRS